MDQSSLFTLIIGLVTAVLGLAANAVLLAIHLLERKDRITRPTQDKRHIEPPVHQGRSSDDDAPAPPMLEMTRSHDTNDQVAKSEATHMSSSDPL